MKMINQYFQQRNLNPLANSLEKPLKEILELNVKTLQSFTYLTPVELFKAKKPEEVIEKNVAIFLANGHNLLDWMHHCFAITEKNWLDINDSVSRTTRDAFNQSRTIAGNFAIDAKEMKSSSAIKSSSAKKKSKSIVKAVKASAIKAVPSISASKATPKKSSKIISKTASKSLVKSASSSAPKSVSKIATKSAPKTTSKVIAKSASKAAAPKSVSKSAPNSLKKAAPKISTSKIASNSTSQQKSGSSISRPVNSNSFSPVKDKVNVSSHNSGMGSSVGNKPSVPSSNSSSAIKPTFLNKDRI